MHSLIEWVEFIVISSYYDNMCFLGSCSHSELNWTSSGRGIDEWVWLQQHHQQIGCHGNDISGQLDFFRNFYSDGKQTGLLSLLLVIHVAVL